MTDISVRPLGMMIGPPGPTGPAGPTGGIGPFASTAEAQAGVATTKSMSPALTLTEIDQFRAYASNAEAAAGTDTAKVLTASTSKYALLNGTFFTQSGVGAASRTFLAKARDVVTVTDFLSGGTDLYAAFTAAITALVALGGGTIVVPSGTWFLSAEVAVPGNINIVGAGVGAAIFPSAAVRSLFAISAGLSSIRGLQLANTSARATSLIYVSKSDALPVTIEDNYIASGNTNGILWNGGTDARILRNTFNSTGIAINFADNGINSFIAFNKILGSKGILFNKSTTENEGTIVLGNKILPGNIGANAYCISIVAGLELTISGNILDQIVQGDAIDIDASTYSVNNIKITDNWLGSQVGAGGANYGILAVNGVRNLHIRNNTITGWQQAGIYLFGSSGAHGLDATIEGNNFYWAGVNVIDVKTAFSDNARILNNTFNGTNSIVEGSTCTGRVDNNIFRSALPSAGIASGFRYGRQTSGMVLTSKVAPTILSGTTAIAFAHGLSYTPTLADLWAMPTNLPTTAIGELYFTTLGATNATVNCRTNPGASNAGIAVFADLTR